MYEARALTELIGHIEESLEGGQYLFKLQELHEMLVNRLKQYGIDKEKNRTQLKEKLLLDFPDASEQSDGRHAVIAFPDEMKKLMKEALRERDHSYKMNILAQAAKIIREDAFKEKTSSFSGSFDAECQKKNVPPLLLKHCGHLKRLAMNVTTVSRKKSLKIGL